MKLNSKDIIALRDKICKTKTKYWRIIKSENIMTKKAKATDIKEFYSATATKLQAKHAHKIA